MAQKKYESRNDWQRKVIHWELCKKLKFYHVDKWYIDKPESVMENDTHKILWDKQITQSRPEDQTLW